jgi:hypothetical protein
MLNGKGVEGSSHGIFARGSVTWLCKRFGFLKPFSEMSEEMFLLLSFARR